MAGSLWRDGMEGPIRAGGRTKIVYEPVYALQNRLSAIDEVNTVIAGRADPVRDDSVP